jgi:hypothetical protein
MFASKARGLTWVESCEGLHLGWLQPCAVTDTDELSSLVQYIINQVRDVYYILHFYIYFTLHNEVCFLIPKAIVKLL